MENNLRKIRKAKGLSQQKCADDVGISLRTWQRYENGHIGCLEYLKRIAAYFDVTIDAIESETDVLKKEKA